jgi:hypothetical protein
LSMQYESLHKGKVSSTTFTAFRTVGSWSTPHRRVKYPIHNTGHNWRGRHVYLSEKYPCNQESLPRTLCSRVQYTNVTPLSRARVQHKEAVRGGLGTFWRCPLGSLRCMIAGDGTRDEMDDTWTGGKKTLVCAGAPDVGFFAAELSPVVASNSPDQ